MSSPVLQPRTRVTRIAQEAVDRARGTTVSRARSTASWAMRGTRMRG